MRLLSLRMLTIFCKETLLVELCIFAYVFVNKITYLENVCRCPYPKSENTLTTL